MSKTKVWSVFACAVLLLVVVLAMLQPAPQSVTAAPQAAPTPVSVTRGADRDGYLVTFFDAQAITADTRGVCAETKRYDVLDIQYTIDQGVVNTTTLTLQHTNDKVTYIDGADAVTNNAADASDMKQLQGFGVWTCLYADVTNANTITITASALVK